MSKWVNWILGGLALAGVACSSDDNKGNGGDVDAGGGDANVDSGGNPPAAGSYAMAILIFGANNQQTTYVTTVDSLDVTSIDTSKAREFAGQANIAAYNGYLYISSGEAPTIKRYTIGPDKTLKEDGPTLSFARFGVAQVSVDAAVNTFVSPTKAYLIGADGTQVAWNPTEMSLGKVIQTPNLKREGYNGVKSSSGIARGNRLYRMFYWSDLLVSPYKFSDEQLFAVYDTDTDSFISATPETRCPALGALGFAAEGGTIYFSNWFYNVPGTLQQGKPQSCLLRLPPGGDTLDAAWAPKFRDLNGGHEGAQLSYVGGKKAIFATLREEALGTITPTSPSSYEVVSGENWESWSYDLETGEAKHIADIARLGAQQSVFHIDGRTFVLAPNKGFSESKGYELKADGSARQVFTIKGWSRAFVKIK